MKKFIMLAMLLAVAPDDGRVLAEMTLPSTPVWDGMAAAAGTIVAAIPGKRKRPADAGLGVAC